MRCLILAVFLAILQTAPPVPRKAADNPTDASRNPNSQALPDKPATPQSAVNIEAPKKKENTSNTIRAEDAQKSVKISELPPVSVSRDWIDYVALGFTGALVLVGIVGILAAIKTLRAVGNQTKAIIESQKPQIAATGHGNPPKDLFDRETPRVQIALHNRGQSAAYDLIYESWIELLKMPFVDFTASADHFKQTEKAVLYPNHNPMIINVPIRRGITNQEVDDLLQLRLYACVRIRVEYRDAFNPKRYSEFGFLVYHNGMGFLPKYNDAN